MIALISGSGLLDLVVFLVCGGLFCWLCWWFLDFCKVPEPFNKILRIIIALVALILCANALFSISGHGFISWR